MSTSTMSAIGALSSPFTQSQWQELEHQALIFKYLMAGLPVPTELVIPIKKSFDSISMSAAKFFNHPTLGYCSFFGKKPDPEPGRCRRTDGKKWRCSKDAYGDSKYCERHMHRGRNRSRKPVEAQTITQSSSTVTSLSGVSGSTSVGGCGGSATSQNLPLHSIGNPQGMGFCGRTSPYQLQMDPASYGIGSKECRYIQGMKQEADEHSLFSDPSGSAKTLGMDTSLESAWPFMPSRASSSTQSKLRNSTIPTDYPKMHTIQDIGQAGVVSAFPRQTKQQHSFFGGEFGLADDARQEGQCLRPFFEEWPMTKDSWSDLEDDRSNRTSFSTTQLSISIPMASSDFSATSSMSPNDD